MSPTIAHVVVNKLEKGCPSASDSPIEYGRPRLVVSIKKANGTECHARAGQTGRLTLESNVLSCPGCVLNPAGFRDQIS